MAEDSAQHEGIDARPSLRTSDPAVLRALAHPLRVEILAAIDDLGEATATQIAERIGDTPSNCSFHLRTLAKAGFIERAEAQGTSKPWKAVHKERDLRPDPNDPESVRSSGTIGALYVQHEADRMVRFLTTQAPEAVAAWSVTVTTSSFWATPEELAALAEEVHHLADRFAGRSADPSLRPAGSRKAYLFATVNPDLEIPATPAAE
ncbi:ArsR/SmtB family transcription factor [Agrococcus terreus]|uniref:Transcriptional regulator n=1 Tax=Agrococcus terreus TaxID=574649 RepID=A0ABQ2KCC7_9MICO|nr:winged helix-turn-helix domain-containing protein [Agrococcus terreus]GGN78176.1 transcriptional regulator [Agrococcus terreus]